MIIRSVFLVAVSMTALFLKSNGQAGQYAEAGGLPKIVPPSPEVASIANVAQISNSMFTGSANASVPLYTIKHGNLTHPVELRYSTNGLKVTENPSSVGMGWNLMAGGSISRVVHDEPDGESDYLTPPSNFGTLDQTLLDYVNVSSQNNKDTEFDEYSISAGGLSGKFYIDGSGVARFTSHSNLKVTTGSTPGTQSSVFVVTATDGSKYYFGGLQGGSYMVERTTQIFANSKDTKFKTMTTAWFLTKIVSAQGDEIHFNYTSKPGIVTKQGAFQQVVLNQIGYSAGDCNLCTAPAIPDVSFNKITYNSYYLNSITAGDITVSFIHEDRPDASYDKRLTNIDVTYDNGTSGYAVKNYSFEYEDLETVGINTKYYLQKVKQHSSSLSDEPQVYEFEYNSGELPHVDALSVDYMGYYNGKSGNGNLFPRPPNYADYINGSSGVDRSPDFTYAKRGALKKLIYPTGGYEEFEYEGHVLPEQQTNTTYTNTMINTPGTAWDSAQIVTETIFPSSTNNALFTIVTRQNPGGPQPGDPGHNPPDNIWDIAKLEVIKTNGTPQTVFVSTIRNWETTNHTVALTVGNTYQLKLTVWGLTNDAALHFNYNPVTTTDTVNVDACGIRVKKITSYDPVTNTSNYRYYKYTSLADQDLSSGVGTKMGAPFGVAYLGGWCAPTGMGQVVIQCPGTMQISSTSLTSLYSFNGSPVAYKYVLESNDPAFANGVTEHEYHGYYIGPGGAIALNHLISTTPSASGPDMNGMEKKTIVYKKEGSSFIKQQETENEYSSDTRVNHYVINNAVRKRWDHSQNLVSYSDELAGYDVSQYILSSGWIHLDRTTTKTYDPAGLNPVTQVIDYTYGNESHMQPTSVAAQDSKSGTLVTDTKFPVDYPSTAPYTDMLAKNMQTAPVETIIKRNSTEQVKIKNNFYKWHDNGTDVVIAPSTVQTRTGTNSLENKLVYDSYDAKGNVLQATGQDGVTVSFIWGYGGEYPVAKITGKSYADAISQSSINLTVVNNPASVGALRTELNKLYTLSGAFVTTSIYKPFIGVIQETDQRNRVTYYEYDGFNRLAFVKDHDQNVIKKFCYNYAGQAENCMTEMDETPDWQATSQIRCKPCPANSSYITNMQQHEEKDNNPYSPTYNTYRWVDDNVAGSCVISADWQNTATSPTCVQGACGNTGYQDQEQRDMNPCSATYNTTRTVTTYNASACTPQTGVTITYSNTAGVSGYTAVYINNATEQTYSFSIPSSGSGTLGCIPAGSYSLTISKTPSGFPPVLLFGSGCQYTSGGWSASFNVNTTLGCGYTLSIEDDL